MKKSLLALAVLGAFAGVASAQSSVTLFGIVDLNARYVKNDGDSRRVSLSQDGLNSSRFGVRGTEDLGGGLKAGFWLEGALSADTGSASTSKFWGRRSTVSLLGGFGEVRLGRDYTPTFLNNTVFDAFGTVGLGDSSHVLQIGSASSYGVTPAVFAAAGGGAINTTFARADNSIGYFLPTNIGGLYGQAMVAASEGAATNAGRYVGGRIGFAAGPFDVAAAYADQRLDAISGGKQKTGNIGGSYDFGVAKILGYYNRDTVTAAGFEAKENRYSISGIVPMGQGEIHAGYSYSKMTNNVGFVNDAKVDQFALGYVYNLSKRTALYSNVARLNNKGTSAAISLDGRAVNAGGKSTGAEFGVRHIF